MKRHFLLPLLQLCILLLGASLLCGQNQTASLRGTVSDPSGAVVPGALVQLRGPRGEQRVTTGSLGDYAFPALQAGKYTVRFIAKGFTVTQRADLTISGALTLDAQLTIQADAQVINVEDEANRVSVDPNSNGGAIILGDKILEALSDDPDELQQQLLAMAGPGAGPNGGQIYVDGFSGAQLPNKASIREVRINSNPFSAEYDRPGMGRIEIFTRAGNDVLHGGVFGQYNKEALNSRSPLLTQAKRPQYKQEFWGINLSGPIKKQKSSFGIEMSRRSSTENAFIYATTLDDNLNPLQINQTVLTPQTFFNGSGRIDYAINTNHSLVARYGHSRNDRQNSGVGDFNLASRAYQGLGSSHNVQLTETAIISPRMINETRFQYARNNSENIGDNTVPSIFVQGAFNGGGAQIGRSGNTNTSLELNNSSTYTYKTHAIRWGGRFRQSFWNNTSVNNFGGTFTFQGGSGPALDANNQPISGTSIGLTGLEVYRRTLLFQRAGFDDAAIRLGGGGAYQFSRAAGSPDISIRQFDAGVFVTDDWRARHNVTFSYGLRYEAQTNVSDFANWAPRVAVAWGVDSKPGKPGKTVLRAGVGAFYDRVSENTTLQALRFNGVTQQSFLVTSPGFYPIVPSVDILQAGRLPQNLQLVDGRLQTSRNYQVSIGGDRQVVKALRISANYSLTRGVHLQRSRNINAPINGLFPFGDSQIRTYTEGTGFSRSQQLSITPAVSFKKLFVAGFYSLSYGKSDAEGQPADPYNLRAEWGPSAFSDVRHRMVLQTILPLPWKISVAPAFIVQSGAPYNISIGRDLNLDSVIAERPSLSTSVGAGGCTGSGFVYKPEFGCFNLNPAPGTAIHRNYGRGPSSVNLAMLRASRTWVLGKKAEPVAAGGTTTVQGPGGTNIAVPAAVAAAVGMPGAPGGPRRYNLNLSIMASNPLNHTTYSVPSGDLSSPFFGVFRTIGGGFFGPSGTTFNRKIDVQLRLNF